MNRKKYLEKELKQVKKGLKQARVFIPWRFEKFRDDAMIYSVCPICNHAYSTYNELGEHQPRVIYNFCPNCGGRRWRLHTKINLTINRRNLYPVWDGIDYDEDEENE